MGRSTTTTNQDKNDQENSLGPSKEKQHQGECRSRSRSRNRRRSRSRSRSGSQSRNRRRRHHNDSRRDSRIRNYNSHGNKNNNDRDQSGDHYDILDQTQIQSKVEPTSYKSNNEQWGKLQTEEKTAEEVEKVKFKADFGLSGALAKDINTGNTRNGIVLKYSEPEDGQKPTIHWRLFVFKDNEILETLSLHRQSCFLFGRDDRVCDVVLSHPSCSKQHAVIQFRISKDGKNIPYVMDLGSINKTKLNGQPLDDARYVELREKDCLQFGHSSREYIVVNENSKN